MSPRRGLFVLVALALVALQGCKGDPLGKPCEEDDECGPGYDCYPDVCVQVCTSDDECREGYTCYRYHCIEPGTENQPRRRRSSKKKTTEKKPAASQESIPTPDATAAELRAIRRELERVRQVQIEILRRLEGGHAHGDTKKEAAKKGAPKVVLPPGGKKPAPPKPPK